MAYTLAIVGRPNVGKSTIFNRIVQSKKAIVEDYAGVTRDRLYEDATYLDKHFKLIDTGGITIDGQTFSEEIKMQAMIAIDEADCILFVVDAKSGITKEDEMIASILRKKSKPIIVVVNKVDNPDLLTSSYEFYQFGFEHVIPVSATHGSGLYDVLDIVYPLIPIDVDVIEDNVIRFSLIGRPNVGKSSLFNALINQERSIVSDVDGTTRDAIDYRFSVDDQEYEIVDTAGIKRRGRVYENVEKYSVLRAIKAVEQSDVVLWLIDADEGLIEQDKRVLSHALDNYKPIIVIVNKWDLIKKDTNTQKEFDTLIRSKMPFINDAPILFISAKDKKGIKNIIPQINDLYTKFSAEFSTSIINNILNDAVSAKVHPSHKGQPIRFYYATQIGSKPPKILIFVNNKKLVHFSYQRYLENCFKQALNLKGIKLQLIFINRKDEE